MHFRGFSKIYIKYFKGCVLGALIIMLLVFMAKNNEIQKREYCVYVRAYVVRYYECTYVDQ